MIPGLTGFARIVARRRGLAVPTSAVQSLSGNSGLVLLVSENGYRQSKVLTGFREAGWTEIVSGLEPTDQVAIEGHQILQPGDAILATSGDTGGPVNLVRPAVLASSPAEVSP